MSYLDLTITLFELYAQFIQHVVTVLQEYQKHEEPRDEESLVQSNPVPTTASTKTPGKTPKAETCSHCTRPRVRTDVPTCFHHLNRKQRKELFPEL
jgi:hypothetical protein